jgi:hypothetical protein
VAALPQTATQLGDMLEHAHDGFDLAMRTLTNAGAQPSPSAPLDAPRRRPRTRDRAVSPYRRRAQPDRSHLRDRSSRTGGRTHGAASPSPGASSSPGPRWTHRGIPR